MGLFKILGCIAGAAVAVVAAPIVAPAALAAAGTAAAAAGTAAAAGAAAVTGAAAAAGTAVASTAVGSAVISGAAAASSAVAAAGTAAAAAGSAAVSAAAGTAVGGAVISGAAAAGSVVGTAAGAVGLTSVAAATGTTAGAAAVGTIAGSVAVGGCNVVSALDNLSTAKDIARAAESMYNEAKKGYDKSVERTKKVTGVLAKNKADIAGDLLKFNEIFKTIKNPSKFDLTIASDIECKGIDKTVNFADYNPLKLTELSNAVITSYAGGQIAGVALTGCITSTITTAGTGAAMTSLSGAAATNATMAALGGGTISSGGLGMAGGAIMAKGLVFAPALVIGGFILNSKSKKAIEDAKKVYRDCEKSVATMNESNKYMKALLDSMSQMNMNIRDTRSKFTLLLAKIDKIVNVDKHQDASKMSIEEQMVFYAAVGVAKVLELQIKKTYIKDNANTEKLTANDVVSVNEIAKYSYTNKNIVNYKNLPDSTLDNIVKVALQ